MKVSASTLKLLMHSMGLPKPLIALVEKIGAMGFGGLRFAPLPDDSPLWSHVKPEAPELPCKRAFATRATNGEGRVTIVVFYEGLTDAAIKDVLPDVAALQRAAVPGAVPPSHQQERAESLRT